MNNYNPYSPPLESAIVEQPPPKSNWFGDIGFYLMIIGWLTLGIFSAPAMLFCLIGMLKQPRRGAIAWFILSIPPLAFLLLIFYYGHEKEPITGW